MAEIDYLQPTYNNHMKTRSSYFQLEVPALPVTRRKGRKVEKVQLYAGIQQQMKVFLSYPDRQIFKGSEPSELHDMEMDEDLQSSDDIVKEGVERGFKYLRAAIRRMERIGTKSKFTQQREKEEEVGSHESQDREDREGKQTREDQEETDQDVSDNESDIFHDVKQLSIFQDHFEDQTLDQPGSMNLLDSQIAPPISAAPILTQPPSQPPSQPLALPSQPLTTLALPSQPLALPSQPLTTLTLPSQKCLQPTQAPTEQSSCKP